MSYPILKLATGRGRGREVHWMMYLFVLLLVPYYVSVRSQAG